MEVESFDECVLARSHIVVFTIVHSRCSRGVVGDKIIIRINYQEQTHTRDTVTTKKHTYALARLNYCQPVPRLRNDSFVYGAVAQRCIFFYQHHRRPRVTFLTVAHILSYVCQQFTYRSVSSHSSRYGERMHPEFCARYSAGGSRDARACVIVRAYVDTRGGKVCER